MFKKCICPICGRQVYCQYFPDVDKTCLYERDELTGLEKQIAKKMGIPFRKWKKHMYNNKQVCFRGKE